MNSKNSVEITGKVYTLGSGECGNGEYVVSDDVWAEALPRVIGQPVYGDSTKTTVVGVVQDYKRTADGHEVTTKVAPTFEDVFVPLAPMFNSEAIQFAPAYLVLSSERTDSGMIVVNDLRVDSLSVVSMPTENSVVESETP